MNTIRYLLAQPFSRRTWRAVVQSVVSLVPSRPRSVWRGVVYCLVKVPLAAVTVYGAVVVLAFSVFGITAPLWWFASPDAWGLRNKDSFVSAVGLALQAVVLLLAFPWFLRLLTGVDHWLARWLLVRTPESVQVARLNESRRVLTDLSADTLARIERDLHDGTQARLVAVGLSLARLDTRITDPEAHEILVTTQSIVEEGLEELRDIIRGIHPPALDNGLNTALTTLVARSAIPGTLTYRLDPDPPRIIGEVFYFATAELLTNAARHTHATVVDVVVFGDADELTLRVTDDGQGGASARQPASGAFAGTGLRGLRARAVALDGSLDINSPQGGPTVVTLTIPRADNGTEGPRARDESGVTRR